MCIRDRPGTLCIFDTTLPVGTTRRDLAPRLEAGGLKLGQDFSVAFSPDGMLLVTGSDDGIVRVWKAASGKAVAELSGHTDYVRAVAVGPDGTLIASASDDYSVRVWQSEADGSFSEKAVLSGHVDWVRAVAFSPDGTLIASGSDDGVVFLWDVPR